MFKQTPFQTFNQYLNQLRLKFCLIDILTTHKPIEEIAMIMVFIIIPDLYNYSKIHMVTHLN